MATILLIIAAAIFKAVSNTIAHHKDISIFKGDFWSQDGPFIPHTRYKFDGWHISNSLMIVSFIVGAVVHEPILKWYFEVPLLGGIFIIVFNVFYEKVFIK